MARGVDLTARRLLPLAPKVSQVGNAALVGREAVTLPLDQAAIACTEKHNSALAPIDARMHEAWHQSAAIKLLSVV